MPRNTACSNRENSIETCRLKRHRLSVFAHNTGSVFNTEPVIFLQ